MRYAKGSLSLNRKEDKFVLEFVADSRYVTRSQLFEFARLEYGEYNRPSVQLANPPDGRGRSVAQTRSSDCRRRRTLLN